MTTYVWEKLNSEPLPIEYVPDEHDEARDFEPSFWWNNRRYYVGDFIRCHNNPWMGYSEFPEFIHGMEADEYIHPLFIQLVGENEHDDDYVMAYTDGSAEFINVYEERERDLNILEYIDAMMAQGYTEYEAELMADEAFGIRNE